MPTGNDDDGRNGAMRSSFPPLSVLFGSENAKDYWRREYKQFSGVQSRERERRDDPVRHLVLDKRSRTGRLRVGAGGASTSTCRLGGRRAGALSHAPAWGMIAADGNASAAIPRDMMLTPTESRTIRERAARGPRATPGAARARDARSTLAPERSCASYIWPRCRSMRGATWLTKPRGTTMTMPLLRPGSRYWRKPC